MKGGLTDQSDVSEEDEAIPFNNREFPSLAVDMDEFNLAKANRKKAKLDIQRWIRAYKEKNGRAPTDADTGPIALELADYNHANEKYLEMKVSLIKQDKMPFEANAFESEAR